MTGESEELVQLQQRALQFLVHSFLYYRLGESIVSDEFFDQVAEELRALRNKHPEAEMPYAEVIDPALGPEASGFRIRPASSPRLSSCCTRPRLRRWTSWNSWSAAVTAQRSRARPPRAMREFRPGGSARRLSHSLSGARPRRSTPSLRQDVPERRLRNSRRN